MVGATLGGGIGPLQGIHGLIIDALLSVRIVTGKGEIVTASETENSDLFWAVRGAGANFGIVTSATYRIHDRTNGGQVFAADFQYSATQNASVFDAMTSFIDTLPDAFSLSTAMIWSPVADAVSSAACSYRR
jgi:FAD/FMN-containing dehydrogenase